MTKYEIWVPLFLFVFVYVASALGVMPRNFDVTKFLDTTTGALFMALTVGIKKAIDSKPESNK